MRKHLSAVRLLFVFALAVGCATAALSLAQTAPAGGTGPAHARTYPAHEAHTNEGVTLAADPFDTAAKLERFKTPFRRAGLLPIRVVFSNDGKEPIVLTRLEVRLVKPGSYKSDPLSLEDIYRRIQRPAARPDSDIRSRLPIPLPRKQRARVDPDYEDELRGMEFMLKAVEPGATYEGWFIFDVHGLERPLEGAHVYVKGIQDGNGQELFFFEVPLQKYVDAR